MSVMLFLKGMLAGWFLSMAYRAWTESLALKQEIKERQDNA